jgi:hypothetical protein
MAVRHIHCAIIQRGCCTWCQLDVSPPFIQPTAKFPHTPNSASLRRRSFLGRLLQLFLFGIIMTNVLVTVLLTKASMMNYPGGETLAFFNARYADQDYGNVHCSEDIRPISHCCMHSPRPYFQSCSTIRSFALPTYPRATVHPPRPFSNRIVPDDMGIQQNRIRLTAGIDGKSRHHASHCGRALPETFERLAQGAEYSCIPRVEGSYGHHQREILGTGGASSENGGGGRVVYTRAGVDVLADEYGTYVCLS